MVDPKNMLFPLMGYHAKLGCCKPNTVTPKFVLLGTREWVTPSTHYR